MDSHLYIPIYACEHTDGYIVVTAICEVPQLSQSSLLSWLKAFHRQNEISGFLACTKLYTLDTRNKRVDN